ncbi:carbohydrate ABC transporter permease [Microbacterium immunditiarum]|uniref:Multiple sugar transport system permease protein n=1 Tax=Microbacterium immunditiarum TaxID=337480 RepID=A0A7Y9GKM4_9MICO|nr:sugar ABC transporter permease [Microbacterium immunditiarum]NYE18199.1 multiple sugar transport system permease protein [Microbacterium immunditiarum]
MSPELRSAGDPSADRGWRGARPAGTRPPDATRARARRLSITPYLFLFPGIALFAVAVLYPILQAVHMSLFDWKIVGSATSEFLGLENYRRAFADEHFWLALGNTAFYAVATIIPQIVIGLAVALLLHRRSPVQPFLRVLYYLPVVTSWVVVSLLFRFLFADQGLVNFVLGTETSWLADRWTGMLAISALGVWKGIGWSMMIFLAALQGVPRSLLEAAAMDGAGPWQRFRVVTLPAIWAALAFVTIMLVIGGFNVFISVYLMTGGGPAGRTDVLLTYMYEQAFGSLEFGYGAAIAVILTALVLCLSLIQLRMFRDRNGGFAE